MDAFTIYGFDEHASTTYGNTHESSQLHQYGIDNLRRSTMLTAKTLKLRPEGKTATLSIERGQDTCHGRINTLYRNQRTESNSKQSAHSADMARWTAVPIFEASQSWICVV